MTDLAEIARMRKWSNQRFRALGSPVFEAFLKMEQAAFREGALTRRSKELIGVGIAVAQGCPSCIQWHVEHAAVEGASRQEILEAVEVAMEMGGGQATVAARVALEVMDEAFGEAGGE